MTRIIIHTTPEDLAKMRFAYRPLIEIPLSFRVLNNPALQGGHRHWVEETRRALYDVELPYLESLTTRDGDHMPDFLSPTPLNYHVNIEDDLQQLLETPEQLIRENTQKLIHIDGDSEMRRFFVAHPREAVWCLIEELRLYWQRAFAHSWSQMTSVVDGDILYRGKLLALEGPDSLLPDLHSSITYQRNQIQVGSIYGDTYSGTCEAKHQGAGFQLVPTIFADWVWAQTSPELHPMIIYRARGVGLYHRETRASNSLELAIGAGRARVLQALKTPASTGELARKLGVSSGAVSQILSRLTNAGLVEAHRSGKRVYYRLTRRGEELIALFERIH